MLKLIICVIAALLILLFLFAYLCVHFTFGRRCEASSSLKYMTCDDFDGLCATSVEFKSNKGQLIRGALYTHQEIDKPLGVAIFVHGMGGGHLSYTTEINTLAAAGFIVLGYDNTGTIASEGKALGSFYQAVRDLRCALKFVRENDELSKYKIVLVGHSWGAYAACQVLAYEKVAGVAAFSGPDRTSGIFCDNARTLVGFPVEYMRPFFAAAAAIAGGKDSWHSSASVLAKTDVPVLLLHGDQDKTVTLKNSPVSSEKVKANSHIKIIVYEGRAHNVYQTKESEKYLGETFGAINAAKKKYGKKIPKEIRERIYDIDYSLITQEDSEVMKTAIDFLRSCIEK